jgi:hypothetical protein
MEVVTPSDPPPVCSENKEEQQLQPKYKISVNSPHHDSASASASGGSAHEVYYYYYPILCVVTGFPAQLRTFFYAPPPLY